MNYSWDHSCVLNLDPQTVPRSAYYDLWVFCILDSEGKEIYRDDLSDPLLLQGQTHQLLIKIYWFTGDDPQRCFIWPRLSTGQFVDKIFFNLPQSFRQAYFAELDWLKRTPIPEKTITCDIFGGLANQLFQIMTTLTFAKENNYLPLFDISTTESVSMVRNQKTYWDTVFSCVRNKSLRFRHNFREQRYWAEPDFHYCPITAKENHLHLWGYFCSFRYLDREYIRQQIFSNPSLVEEIQLAWRENIVPFIKQQQPVVSIHVRRGDSLQNETLEKPDINYYRNACAKFDHASFVVFSDDIPWCKENFDMPGDFHYVTDQKDYIDLFLMSLCDHHVISNSTFSWWAAWLNTNADKRVIYPYPWFRGEKHQRRFDNFIPHDWVSLKP